MLGEDPSGLTSQCQSALHWAGVVILEDNPIMTSKGQAGQTEDRILKSFSD